MKPIAASIPGAAYRLADEGSPGPLARQALDNAQLLRRGRGHQALLVMTPDQAEELADYFWSVAGVVAEMAASEREGGKEGQAAQQAVLRIEYALRQTR